MNPYETERTIRSHIALLDELIARSKFWEWGWRRLLRQRRAKASAMLAEMYDTGVLIDH